MIIVDQDDPTTVQQALSSPNSKEWQNAMNEEIKSMQDNQVWNLIDSTPGIKPIRCKWIFKLKTDMDGNPQTYNARLVAKCYRQIQTGYTIRHFRQ